MPRSPGGEYARVYFTIVDDPRFADLDFEALGLWTWLLVRAEQAWPQSADMPMVAPKAAVDKLTVAGLIEVTPMGKYRVHGLDSERSRRADHARTAAAARWASKGEVPVEEPVDTVDNSTGIAPSIPPGNAQMMLGRERVREQENQPGNRGGVGEEGGVAPPERRPGRRTFSASEHKAWQKFGPEWTGFKLAMAARGYTLPPSGSPDDPKSQRNLLYPIVRDWPNEVARWIGDAPGETYREVIDYILEHYRAVREARREGARQADIEQASKAGRDWASVGAVLREAVG